MGKKLFEMEPVVEFDDEGLPVRTARMTFNLDELALIKTGLVAGVDRLTYLGHEGTEAVQDAARAFYSAEQWVRGARDCE